jgi:soluble lytic murein transglycosylase
LVLFDETRGACGRFEGKGDFGSKNHIGETKIKKYNICISILLVIVVLCLTIITVLNVVFPIRYANFVEKYSKIYGVDKNLVYAVIRCESSFNKDAKSKKDARGLMQLTPSTAKWCAYIIGVDFDADLLYNPEYNIRLGVYYISYLFTRFETVEQVIMAYNAGEGNVKKWLNGEGNVFPETSAYLTKVKFCKAIYTIKTTILCY